MKFTTRAGDLADALTLAGKVIPKSPSLSVYSGVRLAVKADRLEVTGSDEGDTTVTVTLPVEGPKPGIAVMLPKPIGQFLHTLAAATEVTVTAEDQTKVTVHAAGSNPYTFRAMDATFPGNAATKSEARPADLTRLAAAVAAVKDCARKNKIVQLISDDTGLRLHATDGIRLARAQLAEAGFGAFSGLLPLSVLEQIAESPVSEVQVDRRGRVLTAAGDRVSIVTRLVDEMFPPVDTVLSSVPTYFVQVPTPALRDALARLGSVAEDKRPLVVEIAGDEIVLRMDSVNLGSGAERIELSAASANEVTFGVNMEFLVAAVATHTGPMVTVGWTAAEMPIFLKSDVPLPVTNVVMPVKLV